jgi:hypothetical protein
MTVIITELRNDLEPDRDPAFNPNIFSEDEEESVDARPHPPPSNATKTAFQTVGRGAVVPPEPTGANLAFTSAVTSPVINGKLSPPPSELALKSVVPLVNGRLSPGESSGYGSSLANGRPSPISSSNTVIDLSAAAADSITPNNSDTTPTGTPTAITIAPAIPGVVTSTRGLKGLQTIVAASVANHSLTSSVPSQCKCTYRIQTNAYYSHAQCYRRLHSKH